MSQQGLRAKLEKHLTKAGLKYFKLCQDEFNERKFVRKERGKGLSTNDFSDDYMTKLENVSENANYYEPAPPKILKTSQELYDLTEEDVSLNQIVSIPEEYRMLIVSDLNNLNNDRGYIEIEVAPPEECYEYVTQKDIDEMFEGLLEEE